MTAFDVVAILIATLFVGLLLYGGISALFRRSQDDTAPPFPIPEPESHNWADLAASPAPVTAMPPVEEPPAAEEAPVEPAKPRRTRRKKAETAAASPATTANTQIDDGFTAMTMTSIIAASDSSSSSSSSGGSSE